MNVDIIHASQKEIFRRVNMTQLGGKQWFDKNGLQFRIFRNCQIFPEKKWETFHECIFYVTFEDLYLLYILWFRSCPFRHSDKKIVHPWARFQFKRIVQEMHAEYKNIIAYREEAFNAENTIGYLFRPRYYRVILGFDRVCKFPLSDMLAIVLLRLHRE